MPVIDIDKPTELALERCSEHVSITGALEPSFVLRLPPDCPLVVFWEGNLEWQGQVCHVALGVAATDRPTVPGDPIVAAKEVFRRLHLMTTPLTKTLPLPTRRNTFAGAKDCNQ